MSRARAAWHRGDVEEALASCEYALALDPNCVGALTLAGIILRNRDSRRAQSSLERALSIEPGNADAGFHLGNLHREHGRFDAAIVAYETARTAAPAHPSLLNNLALAYEGKDDLTRAAVLYRGVLAKEPRHAKATRNLAHLLCRMKRYDEAAPLCASYLQSAGSDDADLWVDYGICLLQSHDYVLAESSFRRALALVPGDAVALMNLGSLLIDLGDYERAEPLLSQVVFNEPQRVYAASLLAYCRQHLCAWDDLDALHARIRNAIESGGDEPVNAFAALSMPMTAASQRRVAERWARDLSPSAPLDAHATTAGANARKLRLGYVSSDFGSHPISFLLTEVWERHDRNRFETFAYAIGLREASALRTRIERAFDHFIDCSHETPEQTARRIRDNGIDVLVDLNGYTTHARSEIFALRPAPAQASWLGYLGTLGAPWYDYIITDRFVTPDDQQPFFAERFLHLPDCYCPSDTRREVAAPPTRKQCRLPEGAFVFCSFNSAYKILPALFDVWMDLLTQLPNTVLWLAPGNAIARQNLAHEAARRGVDPARLVFAPRVSTPEHLARHVHADLFLDTVPYNAGTTANDALFMGLPVLTCTATTMAGRVAASQLHAIGLPELVTHDLAGYQAFALQLAREPSTLAALRERLAANRHTRPLFDMPRFVAGLEESLLKVGFTGLGCSS